jgi:hypothetical protein
MNRSRLDELRIFASYARRLPGFVRTPIPPREARPPIEAQLRHREDSFLRMLDEAVYGNPQSPYRALLDAASVELGDARRLVHESGLEPALATLRDEGVYVTLDEFKGRRPIERPGIAIPVGTADFDNPLCDRSLVAASGGSSGSRRRVTIDLDLYEYDAAHHSLFLTSFSLWGRPYGLWRALLPSTSGLGNALRQLKAGEPIARWFTPWKPPVDFDSIQFSTFTTYTVMVSRLFGAHVRAPEYCPPQDARRVARWLADTRRSGRPAVLDTQPALAVRTCLAAKEEGLDVSGTFFRLGGEPYTQAQADVFSESGSQAVSHYTMAETGRLGMACGDQAALDDVHLLTDKLAVLQREKPVDGTGATVGALHYTTLLPSAPKLMINVESDDYGVLERRDCGCPLGELGMSLHLHTIRSYEKLTSEGNHFLGSDLITLVDRVLPERFGGAPTDYQLVEDQVDGLPKVNIVVQPRLGEVAEDEVVSTVLSFLSSKRRNRLMADVWRDGETLRVVRAEPSTTAAGKILPLHIQRSG